MNPMNFPLSFGYDDIIILDQENLLSSRLDANTTSEAIRGVSLRVPLIAANMSTVTNITMCTVLANLGAMGFMHRAAPDVQLVAAAAELSKRTQWVAMSVGAELKDYTLAKSLINAGASIIVIDIANGFSLNALDLGERLKSEFPHIKIVIGNTTNVDIFDRVNDWADAIKVGISQGSGCETEAMTGVGNKQFSAVYAFKEKARSYGMPIIADGSIKKPSDFCKAIAAGANSAMAGGIFARCPESAAQEVWIDDKIMKVYAGMASRLVQNEWKGGVKPGTCSEGKTVYLPLGEPVDRLIERYSGGLRSSITYSRATDVKSFQDNVRFARLK